MNPIRSLALLLIGAAASSALAQPMVYFRNLDVSDGLPNNFISSFFEDQQGFMWIGTHDGLVRYDGVSFEPNYHSPGDSSTIGNNYIAWDMQEDELGRIWITLHGHGFCRYDPLSGQFRNFSFANGTLPGEWADHTGNFIFTDTAKYITCLKGILKIDDNDRITTLLLLSEKNTEGDGGTLRRSCIDKDRWLWMLTNLELTCYDLRERKWAYPGGVDRATFNFKRGPSGAAFKNGHFWFSTWLPTPGATHRYLYNYDLENDVLDSTLIAPALPRQGPFADLVHVILPHSDGSIWLGTEDLGLLRFDPSTGEWRSFQGSMDWRGDLPPGPVHVLYEDRKGNIWIGTERGVSLMAPERQYFRNYDKVATPSGPIDLTGSNSLAVGPQDDIWLGKLSHGLLHLDRNKEFIERIPVIGDPKNKYRSYVEPLFVDGDVLLAHVWYESILSMNTKTGGTRHFEEADSGGPELLGAYRTSSGQVFAWGWGRIGKLDLATGGYDFINTPINRDGRPDFVWQATEDDKGNIWIGMGQNGIACVDRVSLKIIDQWTRDTLRYPKTPVWKLIHQNGKIWFSYGGDGLGVYDMARKSVMRYTKKDGLCNDAIYGMVTDADDGIWVFSSNGISWFDEEHERFKTFTEADGMISQQVSDAELLSNGNMLLISDRGLIEFDPERLKSASNAQQPSLRSIQVYDRTINIHNWLRDPSTVVVPYDRNYLRVEFSALEFFDPEKIQFAYRLQGAEERWNYTDHSPLAIYTNLRGGEYRLCVKRTNVDGIWGPEMCIPIFVTTPFYNEWWFFILAAIVFIALTLLVYRWQLNKKLAILRVRDRLSRDLHDEIGSALSSINIFSSMAKRQKDVSKKEDLLERIGTSAKGTMQNMDDIIWAIDPNNDQMLFLAARMREFAAPLLEARNITLKFKSDPVLNDLKLDMVKRRDLFLIFKEAVNNMAKYSNAEKAVVRFAVEGRLLTLSIEDDGQGFDMHTGNDRHGLKNMKDRTEELNGIFELSSAPGKGCRIKVIVPLT